MDLEVLRLLRGSEAVKSSDGEEQGHIFSLKVMFTLVRLFAWLKINSAELIFLKPGRVTVQLPLGRLGGKITEP